MSKPKERVTERLLEQLIWTTTGMQNAHNHREHLVDGLTIMQKGLKNPDLSDGAKVALRKRIERREKQIGVVEVQVTQRGAKVDKIKWRILELAKTRAPRSD